MVHLDSNLRGGEGNRVVEASGEAHLGWVSESTGRNASESRAGLESDDVDADPAA